MICFKMKIEYLNEWPRDWEDLLELLVATKNSILLSDNNIDWLQIGDWLSNLGLNHLLFEDYWERL